MTRTEPGASATIASCVLNLSNTILGTGLLALPVAFKEAGLASGMLLLILSSALGALGLHLLAESALLAGLQAEATFYTVCEAAKPRLSLLVDGCILLGTFFGAAAYLIVATDCFEHLSAGHGPRWPWTLLALGFVTPFCMLRRLDALKYTGLAAVVVLLLLSALIVSLPFGGDLPSLPPCPPAAAAATEHCRGPVHAVKPPLPTLRAFAIMVNAYVCQPNLYAVVRELERPTRSRMLAVISGSVGLALALYTIVGIAGYLTFGDSPLLAGDILNSYPPMRLVNMARLGVAVVVITSYPLQAFAFRAALPTFLQALADLLATSNECRARCAPCLVPFARVVDAAPRPSAREVDAVNVATDERASARLANASNVLSESAAQPSDAMARPLGDGTTMNAAPDEWTLQQRIALLASSLNEHFALDRRSVAMSSVLLLGTTVVALLVSDLGVAIELGGALLGNVLTCVAPGLVYSLLAAKAAAASSQPEGRLITLARAMVALGVGVMPVSVIATFT